LYAFLWGKDAYAQGMTEQINLNGFEEFVQEHYKMQAAWHKVILFFTQDEFSALGVFQTLYEGFTTTPSHASDNAGSPMGDYSPL
jgi:hypothetical protein